MFKEQLTYSLWDDNVKDLKWILENINAKYVFLWTCNSILDEMFEAIIGTEFKYKTLVTWVKQTPTGKMFYGLGNTFRNSTEQIMVLYRHKAKSLNLKMRNVVIAPAGKRTIKPKDFEYELIDSLKDKGPKGCYIFSGSENFRDIDTCDII